MNLISKIKKISICSLLSAGMLMPTGSIGLSAILPPESVSCELVSSESSVRRYAIRAIKKLGGEPVVILIPKNYTLSSGNVIVSIPQRVVLNGTSQVINTFQKIVSVGKFVSAYSSESSNSHYRVVLGYIPENASLSNEPVISYIPQVMNTPGKPTLVLVPQEINLIGSPERAYISYDSEQATLSGVQAGAGILQTSSIAVRPKFVGATNTQMSQTRPNAFRHPQQPIVPVKTTQAPKIINMHSSPILSSAKPNSTPLNPVETQKLTQILEQAKTNQVPKITAQNTSNVSKLNKSIVNSINNVVSKDTNKDPQFHNLQNNLFKDSVMRASLPACSGLLSRNNAALKAVNSDAANGIEKNNMATTSNQKHTNVTANPVANGNVSQGVNNINRTNSTAPVQKSSEVNKNLSSKDEALRFKGWIRSDKAQKTTHQDSSKPLNISERAVERIKKEISDKEVVDNFDDSCSIILVDEDSQEFIETQIAPTDDVSAPKK